MWFYFQSTLRKYSHIRSKFRFITYETLVSLISIFKKAFQCSSASSDGNWRGEFFIDKDSSVGSTGVGGDKLLPCGRCGGGDPGGGGGGGKRSYLGSRYSSVRFFNFLFFFFCFTVT